MLDLRLIAVALVAGGCVVEAADLEVGSQAVVQGNGVRLNGVRLNGVRLNGVRLNGVRLDGVRLDGVRLDGSALTAIADGVAMPESELVGSTWEGALSDGGVLPLRLDAIDHGDGANADVTIYQIGYQTADGWSDLCDGAGALAVQGTWNGEAGVPQGGSYRPNDADFTFACRGFAIAKCVELGYKPWLDRTDYLATCTRALRADFCGDGTPYTVDGTTVNLHDRDGIQTDDAAWPLEARWSRDGATCIGVPEDTRFFQAVGTTPSCLASLPPCGDAVSAIRITTELPPVDGAGG